jgi:hypothetical protein
MTMANSRPLILLTPTCEPTSVRAKVLRSRAIPAGSEISLYTEDDVLFDYFSKYYSCLAREYLMSNP